MASAKLVRPGIFAAAVIFGLLLGASNASPVPDSAGMVDMPPGLAYGGIPYGSISGMLAASEHQQQQQGAYYGYNNLQADASALVPDTRTGVVGY